MIKICVFLLFQPFVFLGSGWGGGCGLDGALGESRGLDLGLVGGGLINRETRLLKQAPNGTLHGGAEGHLEGCRPLRKGPMLAMI